MKLDDDLKFTPAPVAPYLSGFLGIHETYTTPLNFQSDGIVKRFNKSTLDHLSMFLVEHQPDWSWKMPLCVLAYLSAGNETTQLTQEKLAMGQGFRPSVELVLEVVPYAKLVPLPRYVVNLQQYL